MPPESAVVRKGVKYTLHCWSGPDATDDKKQALVGVADGLASDLQKQHNECEIHTLFAGRESKKFVSLFEGKVLKFFTGAMTDTDFPFHDNQFVPHLFNIVFDAKSTRLEEVPMDSSSLLPARSLILDDGMVLYQWNGSGAGVTVRSEAEEVVANIRAARADLPRYETVSDLEQNQNFWLRLGGKPASLP